MRNLIEFTVSPECFGRKDRQDYVKAICMRMTHLLDKNESMFLQCKIQFIKAAQFVASGTGIAGALRPQRPNLAGPWQWAITLDELLSEERRSPSDIVEEAAPMCQVCWALKAKSASTLLRCARCQEAVYCSSECQLE